MSETTLYTLHVRGGDERHVRAVGDGRHPLGVLPPVWSIWRGLWIMTAAMLAALAAMAILLPQATGTVYLGFVLLTVLEGSTFERLELRLRGWEEVGVTEARSEEGAEEDYRAGRSVTA